MVLGYESWVWGLDVRSWGLGFGCEVTIVGMLAQFCPVLTLCPYLRSYSAICCIDVKVGSWWSKNGRQLRTSWKSIGHYSRGNFLIMIYETSLRGGWNKSFWHQRMLHQITSNLISFGKTVHRLPGSNLVSNLIELSPNFYIWPLI